MHVVSEVGKGTTFSLHLPLTKSGTKKISFVRARALEELECVFFLQRKILIQEKGALEETIRRKCDDPCLPVRKVR